MQVTTFSLLFALALSAACAAAPPPDQLRDDFRALERASAATTAQYFVGREDERDCDWPACGGFFVRGVNLALITCADGSVASECHVSVLDVAALGERTLAGFGDGTVVVRGRFGQSDLGYDKAPSLIAEAAWRAAAGPEASTPGAFYLLTESGSTLRAAELHTSAAEPIRAVVHPALVRAGTQRAYGASLRGAGVLATGRSVRGTLTATRIFVSVDASVCLADSDCVLGDREALPAPSLVAIAPLR